MSFLLGPVSTGEYLRSTMLDMADKYTYITIKTEKYDQGITNGKRNISTGAAQLKT